MIRLYSLMENKNFWYKKYLSCSEAFLIAIRHAPDVAIDEIELFYGNRESLLKILEDLDGKIQDEIKNPDWKKSAVTSEVHTKVQYYLREKDSMITKIIEIDKEIIREVELIREQGVEKIKELSKGKKALSKYKSSNDHNEKLDKRV